MKRYLVYSFTIIVVIAIVTIAVVSKVSAAPPFAPFVGRWESTDFYDGSHQTLTIGGGKNMHFVYYVDEGASLCGLDESGEPLYAGYAKGALTADELELSGNLDVYCRTHPTTLLLDDLFFGFTYMPETDTLADSEGFVWSRK